MTTTTTISSSRRQLEHAGPPRIRQATILAATDGTERSDAAIRMALERARTTGARVEVISVLPREPTLTPDGITVGFDPLGVAQREAQRELIEEQLTRIGHGERREVITILGGNATIAIARAAVERRAALIVVGLGHHGISDRLFSDETALQLIRVARIPVLAVPAGANAAPRLVVVAIDFSVLSWRAAQCALEVVADGGEVHLVHAMPMVSENAFTLDAESAQRRWAETRLAALSGELAVPDGVTVHHLVVQGRPAQSLLDHAARVHADLIVTGTHGKGFVARMLLGSVATKLVRATCCPIMAIPRDPLPALDDGGRGTTAETDRVHWAAMVGDLTRRNRGRRAIVESDDPELGAHSQAYNFPFIGAVYDERTDHLKLMLGDGRSAFCQLSRNIEDVRLLDVLTSATGQDTALRVQHGTSQTILTFAE